MAVVYIALGSNLDNPVAHVTAALAQLAHLPQTQFIQASSLYQTPPMGGAVQPDYINAVAELHTDLSPEALLDELIALEKSHGRSRNGLRWAARTLDLDILLYSHLSIQQPRLTIPHPGLTVRAFVLLPLLEIAPHASLPDGQAIFPYLAQVDLMSIQKL